MLESNPPRNSRPETHPDDERGRWPQGWRLPRMERFPNALENSSGNAPRSGFLVIAFELGGRQIAERRMQPLSVVGPSDKCSLQFALARRKLKYWKTQRTHSETRAPRVSLFCSPQPPLPFRLNRCPPMDRRGFTPPSPWAISSIRRKIPLTPAPRLLIPTPPPTA